MIEIQNVCLSVWVCCACVRECVCVYVCVGLITKGSTCGASSFFRLSSLCLSKYQSHSGANINSSVSRVKFSSPPALALWSLTLLLSFLPSSPLLSFPSSFSSSPTRRRNRGERPTCLLSSSASPHTLLFPPALHLLPNITLYFPLCFPQ